MSFVTAEMDSAMDFSGIASMPRDPVHAGIEDEGVITCQTDSNNPAIFEDISQESSVVGRMTNQKTDLISEAWMACLELHAPSEIGEDFEEGELTGASVDSSVLDTQENKETEEKSDIMEEMIRSYMMGQQYEKPEKTVDQRIVNDPDWVVLRLQKKLKPRPSDYAVITKIMRAEVGSDATMAEIMVALMKKPWFGRQTAHKEPVQRRQENFRHQEKGGQRSEVRRKRFSTCRQCGETFTNTRSLNDHIVMRHDQSFTGLSCPVKECQWVMPGNRRSKLRQHLQHYHKMTRKEATRSADDRTTEKQLTATPKASCNSDNLPSTVTSQSDQRVTFISPGLVPTRPSPAVMLSSNLMDKSTQTGDASEWNAINQFNHKLQQQKEQYVEVLQAYQFYRKNMSLKVTEMYNFTHQKEYQPYVQELGVCHVQL